MFGLSPNLFHHFFAHIIFSRNPLARMQSSNQVLPSTSPSSNNATAFAYPYDRGLLAVAEEEEKKARSSNFHRNHAPAIETLDPISNQRRSFWRSPRGIMLGIVVLILLIGAIIAGAVAGTTHRKSQNGSGQPVGGQEGSPTSTSRTISFTRTLSSSPTFSGTIASLPLTSQPVGGGGAPA
ncbi:hypothetical protein HGRIS_012465 [Hohenbuehelia grisea]|uniref:Uncharacterized protein n=1 Tax=Hohenbuehelia grisea TaxID=104357 RepID=A0ABR3ISB9_9AGAR